MLLILRLIAMGWSRARLAVVVEAVGATLSWWHRHLYPSQSGQVIDVRVALSTALSTRRRNDDHLAC